MPAIKEIAAIAAYFLEKIRVNLKSGLEFVFAQRDQFPNREGPLAFELQVEINQSVFAVFNSKAPHFVLLFEHEPLQQKLLAAFISDSDKKVTRKMRLFLC